MVTATIGLQSASREAAVTMLKDFAGYAGIGLVTYPGRPSRLLPPVAFVDRLTETVTYTGLRQRNVHVEVVVLHGPFDSADSANQKDRFVDAFMDWVYDNPHAAGANTTIGVVAIEDEPSFVPDWLKVEDQTSYYGTRITLEATAG
jgi:hypothetical protein